MDLIKKLTGKNPAEYNSVAKMLVDNSDIELFEKLVKQDDFLFDFVKSNVAKRIQNACTKDNYLNLLNFIHCYSASYDSVIAETLFKFGGVELFPTMKEIFKGFDENKKAYAAKYFSLLPNKTIEELLSLFRITAQSDFEPLAINSTELLSKLNDNISKDEALANLKSNDEFLCYKAVKFLVNYQAKDSISEIIDVMKKSSLSENIASEIPYLISIEELLEINYEGAMLVLCNIINAIPDIISPVSVIDYGLLNVFESISINKLDSISATMLMLAGDKFGELISNDEYLYDCDKNTKEEVQLIHQLLQKFNVNKLKSLLYDELYEDSDFVLFAVDYAEETEVLETLLDSSNPTLQLKVLSILKEKSKLNTSHKEIVLKQINDINLKQIIEAL